ncbi:MAG: putative Ig domain-containing protein, partial [Halieaceae bacterium]|nr:putative Ig domain-containing protein [Halieaceae bacterium]
MTEWPYRLTRLDRLLSLFTRLRPGEGRSVMIFFGYALLLMLSYYILKTVREPLLLSGAGAEFKSYAYGVTALLLLLLVPLYGALFRRVDRLQLTRFVTGFFLFSLLLFYLLGRAGISIGFAYYVWVGVFSVMITAQFWAFAADSFNVKSGQRLFPLIMVGATLGGLVAPALSGLLFRQIGPWPLLLIAAGLLALTIPCVGWGQKSIPPGSTGQDRGGNDAEKAGFWGGLSLVLNDRYLFLLALLIILLNWVNTTGEYILAELVVRYADDLAAADPAVDRGGVIAGFYGSFFSIVNLLTLLLQVFLVAHILRWIGVKGAILVLPIIAIIGYGMVVFIPVFSIIRVVKLFENATDYSLMNTTRHALYLPLSPAKKYEGKTTIEGFFWRFGDLAQALAVYAGLHWLDFGVGEFAMVNMVLAMLWLGLAVAVAKQFHVEEKEGGLNLPPRLYRHIGERLVEPGRSFSFELPPDTFIDPDEGEVLAFTACLDSGEALPDWLRFHSETLFFSGKAPPEPGVVDVVLRATDFDGAWAEGKM